MAELKEMRAKLDAMERKEGRSGAVPLSPKQALLDARDVESQHPEHRLRWVNTLDKNKVAARQAEGYERVPLAEGGKEVGNLVLFKQKRELYEDRVERQERLNEERLSAHNKEMEETADAVAKILRDKYGANVNAKEFLIGG